MSVTLFVRNRGSYAGHVGVGYASLCYYIKSNNPSRVGFRCVATAALHFMRGPLNYIPINKGKGKIRM